MTTSQIAIQAPRKETDHNEPANGLAGYSAPPKAARLGVAKALHPPATKATSIDSGSTKQTKRALQQWRTRHRRLWARLTDQLRFVVPPGQRVLMVGSEDGQLLELLKPSGGVGLEADPNLVRLARQRQGLCNHQQLGEANFDALGTFDYIVVLWGAVTVPGFQTLLPRLCTVSHARTRLIVIGPTRKWLSLGTSRRCSYTASRGANVETLRLPHLFQMIENAGFEITATHSAHQPTTIDSEPARLVKECVSFFPGAILPPDLTTMVARPKFRPTNIREKTASVVLVMRDERDNVEPIVRAIPTLGAGTEIIIVEGHSTDGTREEIERVIALETNRSIRLLTQRGQGIADAIRQGFEAASGDVIILLEADQTSPPEDIGPIFTALASGSAEFINGSRFIVKREVGAMPLKNALGNWVFAKWLGWLTKKPVTDIFCGLKGIDRQLFRRLNENWGFVGIADPFSDLELALGAVRLGLKTSEVPTHYRPRPYGRSKIRLYRNGWTLARLTLRATRIFRCQ